MTIATAFNPANQLVTKITVNNTTLSFYQDKWDQVDIYILSTDFPKKSFHRNTGNGIFLNKTIAVLKNTGNLDHMLK
tara:strand:+ start:72 stop:302 length:231 start_codon:yes stop_codon:yes gene_type:complete